MNSGVLVGGRKPDEIYDAAVEKTRRDREENSRRHKGDPESSSSDPKKSTTPRNASPVSVGSHPGSMPVAYGNFSVERIIQSGHDWIFIDLATPIGTFSQVTLKGDDLIVKNAGDQPGPGAFVDPLARGSIDEWIAFSSGQPPDGPRPISAPMRYALMAASWLKRDSPKDKEAVNALRMLVWHKELQGQRTYCGTILTYDHNSHYVDHRPFWPEGHPLHYAMLAGNTMYGGQIHMTNLASPPARAVEPHLYLTQENDFERAFEVLTWASARQVKLGLELCLRLPALRDLKRNDRRAVTFDDSVGTVAKWLLINADQTGATPCWMRGIIARAQDYAPLSQGSATLDNSWEGNHDGGM